MDGITIKHVVPVFDILDHDLVSGSCWCRPTFDFRHDRTIVHHNRADELHAHEIGYARPKEVPHELAPLALPAP